MLIAVALLGVRTRLRLITVPVDDDHLGFCGCRPGCKKFLTVWRSDRVRSSVRPHCAAFSGAAGRYGDQRIGSKSLRRTRGSEPKTGFPNPDLFDHFAHSGHRLLTPSFRLQIAVPISLRQQQSLPDLDNLLPSSKPPRWSAPSCSPVLLRQASLAFALTFDPTRNRPRKVFDPPRQCVSLRQ